MSYRHNVHLDEAAERGLQALIRRSGGFNLSDLVRRAVAEEYEKLREFALLVGECPGCGGDLDGFYADSPMPHTLVCRACGREFNNFTNREVRHA